MKKQKAITLEDLARMVAEGFAVLEGKINCVTLEMKGLVKQEDLEALTQKFDERFDALEEEFRTFKLDIHGRTTRVERKLGLKP